MTGLNKKKHPTPARQRRHLADGQRAPPVSCAMCGAQKTELVPPAGIEPTIFSCHNIVEHADSESSTTSEMLYH